MTSTTSSTSACRSPSEGPHNTDIPVDASSGRYPEAAFNREFVASVTGGLDGAVRVAMMLRGRKYQVRDLAFEIFEGIGEIRLTVILTAAEADLLLKRLRRIPAVVSAAEGGGNIHPCAVMITSIS